MYYMPELSWNVCSRQLDLNYQYLRDIVIPGHDQGADKVITTITPQFKDWNLKPVYSPSYTYVYDMYMYM